MFKVSQGTVAAIDPCNGSSEAVHLNVRKVANALTEYSSEEAIVLLSK